MAVQDDDSGTLLNRLRWRTSGALLWPLFAVVTVADAVLLHFLPLAGDDRTDWVPAVLLAGCLNLVAVAALGRIGAFLLRRRRPDLPKLVAEDYAGRVLLGVVAAVFLTVGLIHRPEREGDRRDFAAQSAAFRVWVEQNGDAFARRNVDRADTFMIDTDLFRTCVPGPDPKRHTCVFIDTRQDPPRVRPDRNREPNSRLAGDLRHR